MMKLRMDDVQEGDRSQDRREAHFVRACAVEMHTDISQEIFLWENFEEKCSTPIPGHPFRASQRSPNAHGHVTRAILCEKIQGKWGTRRPDTSIPPRMNTRP